MQQWIFEGQHICLLDFMDGFMNKFHEFRRILPEVTLYGGRMSLDALTLYTNPIRQSIGIPFKSVLINMSFSFLLNAVRAQCSDENKMKILMDALISTGVLVLVH